MNVSQIGRFISWRRADLGLTQAQLAQRLDVTDKAVSKWERGKSLPDVALLSRVAAELRVSVVELLSGEPMNVARSSNLDEADGWEREAAQATPLTLQRKAPEDLLVSPYLFGSNLEHTRSCLYTGLSAQMVRNRKFAGKPTACEGCAMEWFPLGKRAVFALDEPYTRHGEGYHMKRNTECNSVSIFNPFQGETAGLGQHGIAISQGQPYLFGMVVKTQNPVEFAVSLTDRAGKKVYCRTTFTGEGADWTRFEVELTPQAADPDADLRICWEEAGHVCVGAISLLPKDHFHGMRRDVVEAMKELGIKVLRWPGGNFAGEFNWMDGLLPVDMRAPFQSYLGLETQPHTMGYDYSEINTDDFIALCREIGAEPFITINPCWNTPEENAAWVEYCNGDASTPYGKLRAQRGHQEPYNVQLWSLGNEFGYGHMEGDNTPSGYCQIALENGKKMLEASPNLSLCSSGPYPNKEWAELSAKPLAGISQMISQHYYGYAPHYTSLATVEEEYNRCLASVSRMRDLLHQSRQWLEPSTRISMDEWNVWYAWYRPSSVTDGIYAALALHMLMEEAEKSGIALACHFQAVNEGMLCVKPDHVSLTAQGQVFSRMNRWHMGNRLCSASQEAVVSVDREGRMAVTVVNAAFRSEKPVDFSSFGPCSEAVLFSSDTVLPPSEFTVTDVLEQAAGGTFQMPPHSVLFMHFNN
ncbi:helix-turn-helix domain-containing protein [Acutalibacter sp. LFL-21]|uniref:helix-turn-helix domain-containing protein n=1 Tax=Acutalibacter sp. LFL-21 TaxID=2983399 RepID=UPI0021D6856C|nr:helix-turn-helix domain-containing protein [Acutalibacter sp. LFL-21]MCU7653458.1 helix-turn-helix domain-containing protein [Acutalibacter sp. LFL-21]